MNQFFGERAWGLTHKNGEINEVDTSFVYSLKDRCYKSMAAEWGFEGYSKILK